MGVGDEFVLTNVGKDPADSPAASAGAPAAAEHSAHGGMYTLTGDKEDDLESMVGKRVEIEGRLEHQGSDMAGGDPAANTSAAGEARADATSDANQPAGTSDDQPVGTSGAAGDVDETTAGATNTGSTLAEDPAYEGSRSPDEREGIEARRRAESLPRIDVESFREVGGDCDAPAPR
jgi:hypothetical protein